MLKRIKRVFSSVREYKKYAIITPLCMIGEAAIECVLPFVMNKFVSAIQDASNVLQLWPYILALVLMTCASIAFGILGGRFASIASAGFAKNLRHDIYEKIQSFSFENIDKFHGSSLVTRMTTDVNNAQMSFQMCIRIVFRAPLMLIFSSVMAFVAGGHIAWIFIGAAILAGLLLFLIIRGAMKIFKVLFKRYDALNESVQENVSGIRVV